MQTSWHTVTIVVPAEESEDAAALLSEAGCNGVLEEERADGAIVLRASFDGAESSDAVLARVRDRLSAFPPLAAMTPTIETEAREDWSCGWKQHFRPFAIVPGIVVAPSWEQVSPEDEARHITLDPGMAFGTGLHPTTRLCAQAIAAVARDGASLLDVGTGSGLLAILARRLGFDRIAGVEIDADALAAARANCERNDAGDIALHAEIGEVDERFDVVVANILRNTLLDLRDELLGTLAPEGTLILSGITTEQEEELVRAFPLSLVQTQRDGEWSMLRLHREPRDAALLR